jgi:hypothetical protein
MNAITLSLRITAPSAESRDRANGAARVSTGRRQFTIGRPVEFDDAAPYVSAIEYALGAVGGELVNGVREFARRRRIVVDAVEAVVTGELVNGLTYLEVIGESGGPSLSRISVKVFLSSPHPGARALFDGTVERLPLVATLRRALPVQVELILMT